MKIAFTRSFTLAAFLGVGALGTPALAGTLTFDETGTCSVNGTSCSSAVSAIVAASGGLDFSLSALGLTSATGVVEIYDDAAMTNLSDELEFTNSIGNLNGTMAATDMLFFSVDVDGLAADPSDFTKVVAKKVVIGSQTNLLGQVVENADGTFQYCDPSDCTGNIYDGTSSATPVPAALPLFATGLGALGLLGWRRKRKAETRLGEQAR